MFNLNKSKPNNYTNKGSMHKKTSCKQYAMQIEIFFLRNCNEIHSNMICFKRTIKNEREKNERTVLRRQRRSIYNIEIDLFDTSKNFPPCSKFNFYIWLNNMRLIHTSFVSFFLY